MSVTSAIVTYGNETASFLFDKRDLCYAPARFRVRPCIGEGVAVVGDSGSKLTVGILSQSGGASRLTDENLKAFHEIRKVVVVAVLKSRSRLVTFRLSTDEYEDLKRACIDEGARSISDFARAAVMHRAQSRNSSRASLGDDLATLSSRLEELDGALKDLSGRIARVLGSAREPVNARPPETRELAAAGYEN